MPRVMVSMLVLAFPALGQVGSNPLDEPAPPEVTLPVEPQAAPEPDASETLQELLDRRQRSAELQSRAVAAFRNGDYAAAEALFLQELALAPENFVALYNLACCRAIQGDLEQAQGYLRRSIEVGFIELETLIDDPHLAPLRGTPFYEQVVAQWQAIVDARAQAHLGAVEAKYGPRYLYERDSDLRLSFAVAFDQETMDALRAETRRLTEWGLTNVFTDLRDPPMSQTDPWAVVILPNERDFKRWAIMNYGPEAVTSHSHRIGGAFNYDRKELVAMDLGATFRHEFFHALHWRSNARSGHIHPAWVQEGLCSLVEDYDLTLTGDIVITPSWRTNMARRAGTARRGLLPLAQFCALDRMKFTEDKPLANYAHARAIFLWLYQKGMLLKWYQAFDETYEQDPTGVMAFERIFNTEIEAVDEQFRAWLGVLPEVAEVRTDGAIVGLSASLGVQVDPGTGEGPVVLEVRSRAARDAGFRRGDVITAVAGRPTRDMNEFVRVMGSYPPGERVVVSVRRKREHLEFTVTLSPFR